MGIYKNGMEVQFFPGLGIKGAYRKKGNSKKGDPFHNYREINDLRYSLILSFAHVFRQIQIQDREAGIFHNFCRLRGL